MSDLIVGWSSTKRYSTVKRFLLLCLCCVQNQINHDDVCKPLKPRRTLLFACRFMSAGSLLEVVRKPGTTSLVMPRHRQPLII